MISLGDIGENENRPVLLQSPLHTHFIGCYLSGSTPLSSTKYHFFAT